MICLPDTPPSTFFAQFDSMPTVKFIRRSDQDSEIMIGNPRRTLLQAFQKVGIKKHHSRWSTLDMKGKDSEICDAIYKDCFLKRQPTKEQSVVRPAKHFRISNARNMTSHRQTTSTMYNSLKAFMPNYMRGKKRQIC